MKHLCDSNVFVALTLESHPHHEVARKWMDGIQQEEAACFCRATQQRYLRLLTVREWMKEDVCTNTRALETFRRLSDDPRIGFIAEEPMGLEQRWFSLAGGRSASPKRWMDAYLIAFAECAGMLLVTFDLGLQQYTSEKVQVLLKNTSNV